MTSVTAVGEGLGLAGLAFRQEGRGLSRMHLVGRCQQRV